MGSSTVVKMKGRITREEFSDYLAEARANSDNIRGCSRHYFGNQVATLGGKLTCENCTGRLSLGEAVSYVQGYVAAGGDAIDVWPRYLEGRG